MLWDMPLKIWDTGMALWCRALPGHRSIFVDREHGEQRELYVTVQGIRPLATRSWPIAAPSGRPTF